MKAFILVRQTKILALNQSFQSYKEKRNTGIHERALVNVVKSVCEMFNMEMIKIRCFSMWKECLQRLWMEIGPNFILRNSQKMLFIATSNYSNWLKATFLYFRRMRMLFLIAQIIRETVLSNWQKKWTDVLQQYHKDCFYNCTFYFM